MIVSNIKGGLGNQLFCYALGYSVSKNRSEALYVDLERYRIGKDRRGYGLSEFQLPYTEYKPSVFGRYAIKLRRRLNTLKYEGRIPFAPKMKKYFFELNYGYDTGFDEYKDSAFYFDGYWHSVEYFKQYKDDLNALFMPKIESDLIHKFNFQNHESVAVHIRRGDYLAESRFHVQPVEYFLNAIKAVHQLNKDAVFYFFSDDHEFVKKEILTKQEGILVEGKSLHEDFYLMRQCKHNIISNSTFSWWPAWLNSNQDKIMVAPINWYTDDAKHDLIDHRWITI